LSRTVFDGTGGRSWSLPGIAREPWLLDSTRFCSGGGGVSAASSSSAMLPSKRLQLPSREGGEDEKDGLGDTDPRLLESSLSRLWPRRRNSGTITGSCQEPCVRARAARRCRRRVGQGQSKRSLASSPLAFMSLVFNEIRLAWLVRARRAGHRPACRLAGRRKGMALEFCFCYRRCARTTAGRAKPK
jgi:hypothetical protein